MSRPMRMPSTRPAGEKSGQPQPSQSVADFLADQAGHPHEDLDPAEPRLVPDGAIGSVGAADMHEVGLEVRAPRAAPGAEDAGDIGRRVRMRDVEDVVFLAALVPTELAVEAHGRERSAAAPVANDPIGVFGEEPAAVADEVGRDPQAGMNPASRISSSSGFMPRGNCGFTSSQSPISGVKPSSIWKTRIGRPPARTASRAAARWSRMRTLVDRRIEIVPGAPTGDPGNGGPRGLGEGGGHGPRPEAQGVFHFGMLEENERLALDRAPMRRFVPERLDVEREQPRCALEAEAVLEMVVPEKADNGAAPRGGKQLGEGIACGGVLVRIAAQAVRLDVEGAVPAMIAAPEKGADAVDLADAESEPVDFRGWRKALEAVPEFERRAIVGKRALFDVQMKRRLPARPSQAPG